MIFVKLINDLYLIADSEGRTYLFDLDFNDIDCMYSIDAARMGNASHFINHSVGISHLCNKP